MKFTSDEDSDSDADVATTTANKHKQIFTSISTFLSKVTDLSQVSLKDVKANLKTQGLYDRTNPTQKEYIKQTTIELIKTTAASKSEKDADEDSDEDSDEDADEDSDEDSDEDRSFGKSLKNKKKRKAPPRKTKKKKVNKKQKTTRSATLTALYALAKAMSVGPTVFKGLKESESPEEELSNRLKAKGANFQGLKPTSATIAKEASKAAKRKMLEGLDLSAIVESGGGRGRRRTKVAVSYAESCSDEEEEEEEEEGQDW
jgi:hypothetical protein